MADVSRAREGFKAAAWFAEREFPHRWGRTDKLQVEHIGDLGERLRRSKERVIEHDPHTSVQALGVDMGVSQDSSDSDSK